MQRDKTELATFGAGCFWSVEVAFRNTEGVLDAIVGYAGGHPPAGGKTVTYDEVCTGKTGHVEAVQVTYDPQLTTYDKLLDVFWNLHDPTEVNRQGPDVGSQYRSVIFYHTDEQKKLAEESLNRLRRSGKYAKPIATAVEKAGPFYPAEEYHQRYLEKKGLATCRI